MEGTGMKARLLLNTLGFRLDIGTIKIYYVIIEQKFLFKSGPHN